MNRPLHKLCRPARLLPLGAALLLLCAACGQKSAETPDPGSETPKAPMVVTDGSVAETLEEYYDRTAIIARNEWIEGSFLQTSQWAQEYASLEYPGSECQLTFDSGYEVPSEMLPVGLTAGVTTWRADIQTGGSETSQLVQIFHFQKEGRQCFSGLLAGDDRLTTRPAGYAYLALDTRFAGEFRALPDITAPEGTLTLDLGTVDLAAGNVTSREVYPLSRDISAVYCRREDGTGALAALRLESGEILARQELSGSWDMDSLAGGVLTMTRYDSAGQSDSRLRCALTDTGADITLSNAPAAGNYTMVTGVLREKDSSIYLDETCLLRGSEDPENPELPLPADPDPTDSLRYEILADLDGERFLYACFGYEWLERTGVYNTVTGNDLVLESGSALGEWLLGWTEETGLGCVLDMDPTDFSRVDLVTGRVTPLDKLQARLESEPVSRQAAVNENCTRLAVLDEGEDALTLRVFDTKSQECLLEWTVPSGAGYGSVVSLVGEDTAVFTIRRWSTDTGWVYRLNY